jgi:hypothetical protein
VQAYFSVNTIAFLTQPIYSDIRTTYVHYTITARYTFSAFFLSIIAHYRILFTFVDCLGELFFIFDSTVCSENIWKHNFKQNSTNRTQYIFRNSYVPLNCCFRVKVSVYYR